MYRQRVRRTTPAQLTFTGANNRAWVKPSSASAGIPQAGPMPWDDRAMGQTAPVQGSLRQSPCPGMIEFPPMSASWYDPGSWRFP